MISRHKKTRSVFTLEQVFPVLFCYPFWRITKKLVYINTVLVKNKKKFIGESLALYGTKGLLSNKKIAALW